MFVIRFNITAFFLVLFPLLSMFSQLYGVGEKRTGKGQEAIKGTVSGRVPQGEVSA